MANALSTFAQVVRPGVDPKAKKAKKKREALRLVPTTRRATIGTIVREAATKLREYMPIAPKGSWEKTSELVLQAARRAPEFGAFDEYSNYSISIWASYPEKNAVVIGNTNSGELWAATYQVDAAGLVSFPTVVKAEQTFTAVKEAAVARPLREAAVVGPLKEALKIHARIREVQVDDNGAGARAVCVMLTEGWGNAADGHYYTAECITEAAASGVFEGVQSYADHADADEERTRPERSVRDLVGWWSDVHAEESGGKQLLIGTFNIESGNDFALNKMREAKRYAERYKDEPEKQYVGFSIYAGGASEPQEIDGRPAKAVSQITEAGSTDMVTRAGAGGKMLTLKEAKRMGAAATITPEREKQFLESLISGISKTLGKKVGKTVREATRAIPQARPLSESQIKVAVDEALAESGLELDDDAKGKMHAALAKAMSPKVKVKKPLLGENEDELSEDDDITEAGVTGDASLDDILEPDDDDDDESDDDDEDDDDEKVVESGRLTEAEIKKLPPAAAAAIRERDSLRARESLRGRAEVARTIVREKNVPKAARAYLISELSECKTKKAMRERADVIIDAIIRPAFGDGVVGAGASTRVRETSGGLFAVSGIEK